MNTIDPKHIILLFVNERSNVLAVLLGYRSEMISFRLVCLRWVFVCPFIGVASRQYQDKWIGSMLQSFP